MWFGCSGSEMVCWRRVRWGNGSDGGLVGLLGIFMSGGWGVVVVKVYWWG